MSFLPYILSASYCMLRALLPEINKDDDDEDDDNRSAIFGTLQNYILSIPALFANHYP